MHVCVQRFSLTDYLTSVLGNGESQAMQEIARVLRPGGIATLTLSFSANGLRKEYPRGAVYERQATDGAPIDQRHYDDDDATQERLIEPSGLRLLNATYFGEPGIRFEEYWNRIAMRWKLPLLWAQAFLAKLFLQPLTRARLGAACGVALELEKLA